MEWGCCVEADRLSLVREAGFDFAELRVATVLPGQPESVWAPERARLLAAGVPIRSFNVLLPGDIRIVGPEADLQRVRAHLEAALPRMAELGGQHVSFGSGGARRVPDGWPEARARQQILDFLSVLAEVAEQNGITAHIEFLNRKETNIILSLLEAYEYAAAVDRQNIQVLADFYHLQEEQEPLAHLRQVKDRLGYVHVADSGRRHPGSGTYPYAEFFGVLHEIGYDGPISVECRWENPAQEMAEAAAFLRRAWQKAAEGG